MNTMSYKGYVARIEYCDHDSRFIGHLVGIRSIVGFDAKTVSHLRRQFHLAVDSYLEACAKLGQEPEPPHSGRVPLRMHPDLHARASATAAREGLSLNQWIVGVFERVLSR